MNDDLLEYWQDVENKKPEIQGEFGQELNFDIGSIKKSRRNFLKIMGFSFSSLPLASCIKIPVKKSIPYIHKSDQVVPGVANWYATSMDPLIGNSLLVKTREGRPIKIEGNPLCPVSKGGTFATDQASVLSLYDSFRYKSPEINGTMATWGMVDSNIKKSIEDVENKKQKTVLMTRTITSPSTLEIISKLKNKYANFEHIVYEADSLSSILQANQECFSTSVYPTLSLDKADLIVSFSADFLGTWLSPVEYTKQYTARRDLTVYDTLSKLIQFESLLSLTGSNADERFTVSPDEEDSFIINLLAEIQKYAGKMVLPVGQKLPPTNNNLVSKIAGELWIKKGKSVVLSGSHDKNIQIFVNAINNLLGNYGETIHLYDNPFFVGPNDTKVEELVTEMDQGKIGALLFWDVNPIYNYRNSSLFEKVLKKVGVKISFSSTPDETSKLCDVILPNNHFLESWGDYFYAPNVLKFCQPVINPIFKTRMAQESLLKLVGDNSSLYDFIQERAGHLKMVDGFKKCIHDGVTKLKNDLSKAHNYKNLATVKAFTQTKWNSNENKLVLIAYQKVGIRTGEMINNPWLQELPDPITKATWDNYFLIGPSKAKKLNLTTGQMVKVTGENADLTLPVIVQPGVHPNVIGVAIGYGRKVSGKVGKNLGGNCFPFYQFKKGNFQNWASGISVSKTGKTVEMALTQTHHSMEGRDIVRETTLKEWKSDNKSGNKPSIKLVSMWSGHEKKGEQWGMVIDLNKCTGCSGCVVSCNAENNVPVVGKKEVVNRREMHWIRLDRYYKGDEQSPEVVHQPIMCHHCDNAPCETVCPVLATVQSSDGLNQQIYNRCVGTRYCANNCPYKVRRFNWFDYAHDDKYENMVLNPDIVVRSRGVMEKCSMCVQRIQESKLTAKKDKRPLQDGEIKTACEQSCPGDAIVFGNLNDPKSRISKLLNNARKYRLLEELNVEPRVSFLTKVRNKG